MTKGFFNFWDLSRMAEEKTSEFIMWRLAPGFNEISKEIDKNPSNFLENHLDKELAKFSEIFSIEKSRH